MLLRIFLFSFLCLFYAREIYAEDCSNLLHSFEEQKILEGYQLPTSYLRGYFSRRVEPRLARPDYQTVAHPQKFYRGMFLSFSELATVLREGMLLSDVKRLDVEGGISFSSNINEASDYIFQAADNRTNGVGVVFEVHASNEFISPVDPVLNSTKTIFKLYRDLSAGEILNVYIWGEYGLESLKSILEKIEQQKITPHTRWTGVFEQAFSR